MADRNTMITKLAEEDAYIKASGKPLNEQFEAARDALSHVSDAELRSRFDAMFAEGTDDYESSRGGISEDMHFVMQG